MKDWKAVAAGQHHVISREQLIAAKVSAAQIRRLLRQGSLEVRTRGVFALGGAEETWRPRLSVACLWGGPGAVAAFTSAAVLHKLSGFEPGPLEICTSKRKQLKALKFKVHGRDVPAQQITHIDGIPVTNAFRTLRDLLPTLEPSFADRVLDDALRKGLVSVESLRRFVADETGKGHRGLLRIRQMMNERDPAYRPSASEMNARIRQTLIAYGITDFIEEFEMRDQDGSLIGRADVGFHGSSTVVEGQSRLHHSNKEDFERDMERRNHARLAGYKMIEVSWRVLVETPEVFIAQVKRSREQETGHRRAS